MKTRTLCYFTFLCLVALNAVEPTKEEICKTFDQGSPLSDPSVPPAYNYPASTSLRSQRSSWIKDIFTTASFTYWYAGEEGFWIAEKANIDAAGLLYLPLESATLQLPFDYHPGFRVGLGIVGENEWTIGCEYTWFRAHSTVSSTAPANHTAIPGSGTWILDDWFLEATVSQSLAISGAHVDASWHLDIDMANLIAGRPFYQGRNLTVFPAFGLMSAWIRQSFLLGVMQDPASESGAINLPPQPLLSHNRANAWGIGPAFGSDIRYLLPLGFRLQGDVEVDFLYMFYSKIFHSEDAQALSVTPGPYTAVINHYSNIAPILNTALGFGWGKYLSGARYHLDFSALFEGLLFWGNHNLMRYILDEFSSGVSSGALGIRLYGLTFNSRFDF